MHKDIQQNAENSTFYIHTIQYPSKKLRYVKQVEKCDP